MRHAEICHGVQILAGDDAPAPFPEEWLSIPHAPGAPPLRRALATVLAEHAISETVAAALFRAQLRQDLRPEVRAALAPIARDEARHSAFAWGAIAELLERDPAAAAWLSDRLPADIAAFQKQISSFSEECSPEEAAWGLMPGSAYRAGAERAIRRIVLPRLRGLGVGALCY